MQTRQNRNGATVPTSIMQPPETLTHDRRDDPQMAVDGEQLSGRQVDRLYADMARKGELDLTRREQLRFRQMREVLWLCLIPYACLLVAYISGWIARWVGALP